MKILLINTVCGTGSVGRITVDYYNKYKSEGHDVKVIYGRGKNINVPKCDAIKFNSVLDFYYHCAMSRIFDSQGLHSNIATKKLLAFIKEFKPDIIHLHNLHGYYLNYKLFFKYINTTNIKIIWTLHDCWAFTGHCTHYLYNKCNKWETECKNCKYNKEYPASIIFQQAKRNFLLKKQLFTNNKNLELITPSQWLADEVSKSFLKHCPIKVLNNTINNNLFKNTPSELKRELSINENKIVILGVAFPWTGTKGYEDFLELSRLIDNNKYQIIMVGLSKKQLKNLPNNIIGFERVSPEKLVKLYSLSDIFFNPTYEDNYPTVNLEAKACGVKIIAFKGTGGGEEMLDDNDIVLDDRNTLKLIERINNIAFD